MIRMSDTEFNKLLTAALYRAVKLDYADMPSGEELDKTVQPSEAFKQKMKTLLQNPKKSIQSKHRPKRPLYFKILRVAAAVLITFTLLIGSAMVVSPTVRAAVINIVRTWFSSPNEIRYGMNIDDVEDMIDEINKIPPDERSDEDERALLLLEYYLDKYKNYIPSVISPPETSYLGWHPYDTIIEVDLTGDGNKDELSVNITKPDDWSRLISIRVNDIELELTPENGYYIDRTVGGFAIVDIDTGDNFLEIAINDYGMGTLHFFRYDGVNIIYMGMVEGLYDGTGINYIDIPGNGVITAQKQAVILQTWWYTQQLTISDEHILIPVYEDLFIPVHGEFDYFVLMDLPLYTERDETSPTIIMEHNTTVTFFAHDNIEWVGVSLPDGQKGWFKVYRPEGLGITAIITANGDIPAEDVFFMLSAAG